MGQLFVDTIELIRSELQCGGLSGGAGFQEVKIDNPNIISQRGSTIS